MMSPPVPAPRETTTASGAPRPLLTRAKAPLLREIHVVDEFGSPRSLHIPIERPLTLYVDRCEVVTLMTLGQEPELLVLGYLLNQGLVDAMGQVESVTVDWDVAAAAVRTRDGATDIAARTAQRVITTGCGQGTVFGDLMARLEGRSLPQAAEARLSQSGLYRLLEVMRETPSLHRRAGSVHGCALFQGVRQLMFVEDVGRHNALDTIAGWMALNGVSGADKVVYTTGRMTSEMVMKAAWLGAPIVVSRNGVTAMGHDMAQRLGMTLIGRAANRHFLCYTGFERFDAEPETQRATVRVVAG